MAATFEKLTIAAVTEIECCQGRTLEPGRVPTGSVRCPRCNREPWMADGFLIEHEAGGGFFLPHHRAERFLTRQRWTGMPTPTAEQAAELLAAASR